MSTWAARAKAAISQKGLGGTAKTDETPVFGLSSVSSVPTRVVCQTPDRLLSVLAVPTPPVFEKRDGDPAANDPAPTTTVRPVFTESGNKPIDIGTVRPPDLTPKLLAASLALDAQIAAADQFRNSDKNSGTGPDCWCYPHSTAMNGNEIDLFTARLHRFTDKGLTRTDGEALAYRLVIRDREADDRRSCLECRHLSGYGNTSWRCGNWQAAGVAIRPRDTQLPADLVLQLQRCDGFATATPNPRR